MKKVISTLVLLTSLSAYAESKAKVSGKVEVTLQENSRECVLEVDDVKILSDRKTMKILKRKFSKVGMRLGNYNYYLSTKYVRDLSGIGLDAGGIHLYANLENESETLVFSTSTFSSAEGISADQYDYANRKMARRLPNCLKGEL